MMGKKKVTAKKALTLIQSTQLGQGCKKRNQEIESIYSCGKWREPDAVVEDENDSKCDADVENDIFSLNLKHEDQTEKGCHLNYGGFFLNSMSFKINRKLI